MARLNEEATVPRDCEEAVAKVTNGGLTNGATVDVCRGMFCDVAPNDEVVPTAEVIPSVLVVRIVGRLIDGCVDQRVGHVPCVGPAPNLCRRT